jgi:hypothetical protein
VGCTHDHFILLDSVILIMFDEDYWPS